MKPNRDGNEIIRTIISEIEFSALRALSLYTAYISNINILSKDELTEMKFDYHYKRHQLDGQLLIAESLDINTHGTLFRNLNALIKTEREYGII